MTKPNVAKILKGAEAFVTKQSPKILMALGVTGMLTSTVLAVKATPKAMQLIEEARSENEKETFTKADIIKACWKCYVPAAVTGVAATACLIGSNSVSTRRTAALAAAYQISETALSEYKNKVVETIGEKKEKAIRDNIDKDRLDSKPVSKSEVIITGKGNTLCFDSLSGRYFRSDIDKIKKAVNELNRTMTYDMYVSLNDFYDELDLDHTTVGDELGWNLDNGLIEVHFGSQIADDDTPCIVVRFDNAPKYNFWKLV